MSIWRPRSPWSPHSWCQIPQEPKCLDLTDGAFQRLGGVIDPDQGHIEVTEDVLP
ncbi:hypothetical protein [Streptomyces sp. NPDC014733]|uniref:hypothetical protein n=1 Tax=Streptomyces sp. NPDC014733 TaxID=3364885 RepID=UPI0036F6F0A3